MHRHRLSCEKTGQSYYTINHWQMSKADNQRAVTLSAFSTKFAAAYQSTISAVLRTQFIMVQGDRNCDWVSCWFSGGGHDLTQQAAGSTNIQKRSN